MGVAENIRRIRNAQDMTQEEFGRIADVSSMAVSQWENGRAVPRMGAVQKIADYFGIPKSDIIDDWKPRTLPPNAIIPARSESAFLPLRGRVHAGDAQDPAELDGEMVELPKGVADAHPNAYFLEVEGDCMDMVYPEGCLILIDPDIAPVNGSIAAVAVDGADYVMRRMFRTVSTMVLSPESHNPDHADIVITADSGRTVELVGTVVWFQSAREME